MLMFTVTLLVSGAVLLQCGERYMQTAHGLMVLGAILTFILEIFAGFSKEDSEDQND